MQIACAQCGVKYVLDDAQLSGRTRVRIQCPKCKKAWIIDLTQQATRAKLGPVLRSSAVAQVTTFDPDATPRSESLGRVLPRDKTITLVVTEGASKGLSCPMTKPYVVVGRKGGGADLGVDDPEVSHFHCAVESKPDMVRLRDLDSMNGTYVDDQRIRIAELEHLSEFRVGSTVLMVTITPRTP
jgi:predicted Zn finger-like uncharacterized protein